MKKSYFNSSSFSSAVTQRAGNVGRPQTSPKGFTPNGGTQSRRPSEGSSPPIYPGSNSPTNAGVGGANDAVRPVGAADTPSPSSPKTGYSPPDEYFRGLQKALDANDIQKAKALIQNAHRYTPEAYKYILGSAIRKGDDDFLKLALSKQTRTVDGDFRLMTYARQSHPGDKGEQVSILVASNISPQNRIAAQNQALENAARTGDDQWTEIAADIGATAL